MSRWIPIDEDSLKAAGHGAIIDQARTVAVGDKDPVTEAIAKAVARVRRAISTGNVLDADTAKVPASLEDVAVNLALFALMRRLELELTQDQRDTRRDDGAELTRISEQKIKVEAPDTPSASGEMQATGRQVDAVNVPVRLTGRERTSGL